MSTLACGCDVEDDDVGCNVCGWRGTCDVDCDLHTTPERKRELEIEYIDGIITEYEGEIAELRRERAALVAVS